MFVFFTKNNNKLEIYLVTNDIKYKVVNKFEQNMDCKEIEIINNIYDFMKQYNLKSLQDILISNINILNDFKRMLIRNNKVLDYYKYFPSCKIYPQTLERFSKRISKRINKDVSIKYNREYNSFNELYNMYIDFINMCKKNGVTRV